MNLKKKTVNSRKVRNGINRRIDSIDLDPASSDFLSDENECPPPRGSGRNNVMMRLDDG